MVKALRILFSQILAEHIVARRSQPIAAHTSVVALLVGSLSRRRKTHNDVARTDVGIVDNVSTLHTTGHGTVNDDGAYKVAHVSCLATSGPDADTHLAKLLQQFIRSIDDGRNDLARNQHLVTSDGGRNEDVIHSTHAEQVVSIHHDGILGDAFPYGEVARLLPVHVGQTRLRSGTISVHDVAILRITTQDVGDNLAEGLWEDALVDVLDSVMHILLGSTHATHHISVVSHILELHLRSFFSACFSLKLVHLVEAKHTCKEVLGE